MSLANLYRLLVYTRSIDIESGMNFLLTMYPLCNDGKKLDESIALKVMQSPYMSQILSHYIQEIEYDPTRFGLLITRIYDRDGNEIRTIVDEITK